MQLVKFRDDPEAAQSIAHKTTLRRLQECIVFKPVANQQTAYRDRF